MSLDKTSLLAALAATITSPTIEGVGQVNLRQVTVAENDAIRAAVSDTAPRSEFGLRLLVASLINDDGSPVFTEADLPALAQSAGRKVDALVDAVLKANGYAANAADAGNAPA